MNPIAINAITPPLSTLAPVTRELARDVMALAPELLRFFLDPATCRRA